MSCGQPSAGDVIVSTDPTAITTKLPVTAAMPAGTEPLGPPQPAVSIPVAPPDAGAAGVEPCPHCGTSLALDQRYCLECGAPRTYLSGMLLERLRSPSALQSPTQLQPLPAGAGAGAFGTLPPASPSTWPRGNVLTLIAGIGVLLLAMGVGVLIGRSGGSSSAAAPAPAVITVGGASTGAASTSTTPTTPEASAATSGAAAGAAAAAAKHKAKTESSGVGATPGKPAPPAVLKNLHGGSGQSYEQKSKNLPNVVSTG